MFSILHPVTTREALDPVEILTDWKLFQSFASELISPNAKIHSSNEAATAASDFVSSIASTYTISARKTIILDWNSEISFIYLLLEHKIKLGKLWQETRMQNDSKLGHSNIRRMVRKRALEIWERKFAEWEVTP
jgi:hypothetical protein